MGVKIYTFKWPSYLSAFFVGLLVLYLGYTYHLGVQAPQAYSVMSWQVINQRIVIDAGHGGIDPGAKGSRETIEKDINLAIAKYLGEYLTQGGAEVIMLREDDRDFSHSSKGYSVKKREDLQARADIINEAQPRLLISIHVNSFPSGQWSGAQTFFAGGSEEGEALAKAIQKSLVNIMGNTTREAKSIDAYLLNRTEVAGVIVEVGFISNLEEEKNLKDPAYQQKLAWAIFNGITSYLNEDN